MKDRLSKIFGLLLFLCISGSLLYLILTGSGSNIKDEYKQIELTGNSILPVKNYLKYNGLDDSSKYSGYTLSEIKAKLSEHPYIASVEVKFDGVDKVIAEIKEKNIKAVLLNANRFKLITENGEMLPMFPDAAIDEFPIISNVRKIGSDSLNIDDLNLAFNIIDAAGLIDERVENSLAEINLRNGGDALLTFTNLQCPVLFGKNSEVVKIMSLSKIWDEALSGNDMFDNIEYIDLRYKNKIFIGKRKNTVTAG